MWSACMLHMTQTQHVPCGVFRADKFATNGNNTLYKFVILVV